MRPGDIARGAHARDGLACRNTLAGADGNGVRQTVAVTGFQPAAVIDGNIITKAVGAVAGVFHHAGFRRDDDLAFDARPRDVDAFVPPAAPVAIVRGDAVAGGYGPYKTAVCNGYVVGTFVVFHSCGFGSDLNLCGYRGRYRLARHYLGRYAFIVDVGDKLRDEFLALDALAHRARIPPEQRRVVCPNGFEGDLLIPFLRFDVLYADLVHAFRFDQFVARADDFAVAFVHRQQLFFTESVGERDVINGVASLTV